MKRKVFLLSVFCALLLLLVPACDARKAGSLKAITKPYIAQYECTEATLGGENLLEKFEYIEINLKNKNDLEIVYKPKGSERKKIQAPYSFDSETRELSSEIGILGYKFKQSVKIEKGNFTVSKSIGKKQLIMKFKAK